MWVSKMWFVRTYLAYFLYCQSAHHLHWFDLVHLWQRPLTSPILVYSMQPHWLCLWLQWLPPLLIFWVVMLNWLYLKFKRTVQFLCNFVSLSHNSLKTRSNPTDPKHRVRKRRTAFEHFLHLAVVSFLHFWWYLLHIFYVSLIRSN